MPPSSAQELAVLQAVTYAALFDYPLTLRQLRDSLGVAVADEETILKWWRASALLQAAIEYRDGLFIPAGGADLALTRARREAFSRQMLDRDRHVLAFLSRMPFVRIGGPSTTFPSTRWRGTRYAPVESLPNTTLFGFLVR